MRGNQHAHPGGMGEHLRARLRAGGLIWVSDPRYRQVIDRGKAICAQMSINLRSQCLPDPIRKLVGSEALRGNLEGYNPDRLGMQPDQGEHLLGGRWVSGLPVELNFRDGQADLYLVYLDGRKILMRHNHMLNLLPFPGWRHHLAESRSRVTALYLREGMNDCDDIFSVYARVGW